MALTFGIKITHLKVEPRGIFGVSAVGVIHEYCLDCVFTFGESDLITVERNSTGNVDIYCCSELVCTVGLGSVVIEYLHTEPTGADRGVCKMYGTGFRIFGIAEVFGTAFKRYLRACPVLVVPIVPYLVSFFTAGNRLFAERHLVPAALCSCGSRYGERAFRSATALGSGNYSGFSGEHARYNAFISYGGDSSIAGSPLYRGAVGSRCSEGYGLSPFDSCGLLKAAYRDDGFSFYRYFAGCGGLAAGGGDRCLACAHCRYAAAGIYFGHGFIGRCPRNI